MANRYGLQRHIPEEVKLEVRRRSKFGCVNCRSAIYQYEHIDPEFSNATSHDPDNICLLCGGCHDRVTRGRLSKETVRARYIEVQSSNEIRRPFEELDLSSNNIQVGLGTTNFEHARHLLRINGRDLLSITPPKDGSAFPTLNGIFCDSSGQESLRIVDNVWEGCIDAWDISVVGTVVSVKSDSGEAALTFQISPPDKVIVKELNMYLDGCHIVCDESGLLIGQLCESGYAYLGIGRLSCRGAEVGVSVDTRGNGIPTFRGLSIVGGEGVSLDGTGIRVGFGAPSMNIGDISVWAR